MGWQLYRQSVKAGQGNMLEAWGQAVKVMFCVVPRRLHIFTVMMHGADCRAMPDSRRPF